VNAAAADGDLGTPSLIPGLLWLVLLGAIRQSGGA